MVSSVCDEYTVTVFGTEGGSASAALYANLERFLIHQPYFCTTFSASVIYHGEQGIRRRVTHEEEKRDGHAHGRQRGEDAHRPLVAQSGEHVRGQQREYRATGAPQDHGRGDCAREVDAVRIHEVGRQALHDLRDTHAERDARQNGYDP